MQYLGMPLFGMTEHEGDTESTAPDMASNTTAKLTMFSACQCIEQYQQSQ